MSNYKSFETERLILRPTSEQDAAFILELVNTPKWIQYVGDRNVKTVESARAYIETKMLPQLKRLGYGNYTLIRKTDHCKVGTCGLYDREGFEGVDIGFSLLPEYERKGYAYEAASKLKDVAFNELGLEDLSAMTTKDHFASQNLLKKLGMEITGTTKLPDEDVELLFFQVKK
ncbi:MAG: GNAT family N-acetyltransferase [Saprospiraceae bacterium]|nr:GNAT family N-acetyltransferase [Saprospiraceae bacterium]